MRSGWVKFVGVVGAVLLPLTGVPFEAAAQTTDGQSGMTTLAADELTQRSKQPAPSRSGGMSDRGVRTMSIYASTVIPDRIKGPDGKMVELDKSDPSKFLIPMETARRVIQAATRSAYADVCGLPDLGKANYQTMLAQEQARGDWTREQVVMIESLHLFATSFFAGNAAVPIDPDSAPPGWQNKTVEEGDEGPQRLVLPPAPECPPERKQQVEAAINAYVASAGAQ
ncbi:MAG: hypothetical protein QNJ62_08975 [Methyloceanibacter sp.]|nr:hypothetical protein [Methyloceanibacter sp.]